MQKIFDMFSSASGQEIPKNIYTYDEAMEVIGNGRINVLILFVSGFSLMAVISEGLVMAFVQQSARCEFPITRDQQALINGVGFMGVIISCHFWGFLSDTWGRRKVLQAALASTFLWSVLSSFSVDSVMLMLTRFCVGFWYTKSNVFFK